MSRRQRREQETSASRRKDDRRQRRARDQRKVAQPSVGTLDRKPAHAKPKSRRKARLLRAIGRQERAIAARRLRRARRPAKLKALPRRVRTLLRTLG